VVAAVAVAAVLLISGSGANPSSVGPSAEQLYAQEAPFGTFAPYVQGGDPDEFDRSGENVNDTVDYLGKNTWRLVVQNVGSIGFINSFSWWAPNFRVTKVLKTSSGSCSVKDIKSFVTEYGNLPEGTIECAGFAIAPPKCSCEGGGTASVTFEGHSDVSTPGVSYGVANSRIELGNLTLVPYHIPSYIGAESNVEDLPLCTKGQTSSKSHPCVPTG